MLDNIFNVFSSKIAKRIFDFVITLVIIMAAVVTIISFNSNSKGVSNIRGYIPLSIQSGSMEEKIHVGDLIITKEVKNPNDLKVDDVIAFFSQENGKTIIKTHRIVDIYENEGFPVYVTKGDANEFQDNVTVSQNNIISIYNGKRIPLLGYVITFLQTSLGFVICIVFPLLVLFLCALYNFVVTIIEQKKKEMYEQFKKENNSSSSSTNADTDDEFELPKIKG